MVDEGIDVEDRCVSGDRVIPARREQQVLEGVEDSARIEALLNRLDPSGSTEKPDTLELYIEAGEDDLLTNGDNLCSGPWGGLVICEDLVDASFSTHTHLRGITSDGKMFNIARNSKDKSEFAGSCFSPDGKWLFANLQGHGLTLAITGPWEKVAEV